MPHYIMKLRKPPIIAVLHITVTRTNMYAMSVKRPIAYS